MLLMLDTAPLCDLVLWSTLICVNYAVVVIDMSEEWGLINSIENTDFVCIVHKVTRDSTYNHMGLIKQ